MSWNTVIVLQIITSSFLTLWYRQTGIVLKQRTLQISFVVYIWVALSGTLISYFANDFSVPSIPSREALIFICLEGFFIPAYWIIQFKLIRMLGAANSVIIQTLNYWMAASFGLILLGDNITKYFLVGLIFIVSAVYLSLSASTKATQKSINWDLNLSKLGLIILAAFFFAAGMTAEKIAIEKTGLWNYAFYGWLAQFVGATCFYLIFDQNRKIAISRRFLFYSSVAGIITALSGFFFIYALSSGLLSKTIILASSKIVLTSVLAVYFFKENNNLLRRFSALLLAVLGLVMIFLD